MPCLSAILILLCVFPFSQKVHAVFDNSPRLKTYDGQLILESGNNKNISLTARGSGCININGVDVSKAFNLVENVRPQLQVLNDASLSFLLTNLSQVARDVASETRLAQNLNNMKNDLLTVKTKTETFESSINDLQSNFRNLDNNVTRLSQITFTPEKEEIIRNMTLALQEARQYGNSLSEGSINLRQRIVNLENRANQYIELDDRVRSLESLINTTSNNLSNNGRTNRQIRQIKRNLKRIRARVFNDNCRSNPCSNGGTCIDTTTTTGYQCLCPLGWQGGDCSDDVNECYNFVGTDLGCQNGATCLNSPGSYSCRCTSGYFGIHCLMRTEACSSSSSYELCGHGTCINTPKNGHPYYCLCDQGYKSSPSSPICNVDVNECFEDRSPCSVDPPVQCINRIGSFLCGPCPPGYSGNGFSCSDIDECEINNGGCSSIPRVECINLRPGFRCGPCPPGYTGNGQICTPSSPCQMNPCHQLAICRDNPHMSSAYYTCTCPHGYSGNGIGPMGCQSMGHSSGQSSNACSSNPCLHGTCSQYQNGFHCTCYPGYTGSTCNIMVDPCSTAPCLNGGTCIRSNNNFVCMCQTSFTGDRCERRNEVCGGQLSGYGGLISYPGVFGQSYNHNISCIWTISTNRSLVINVTFNFFHLEGGFGCPYDWLQINDGPGIGSQRIGKYCGTALPGVNGSVISTHNHLYLWFRSDHSQAGNGFNFTWDAIQPQCGGALQDRTHGIIQSPGFPGPYPHNRDCTWTVEVHGGMRILFTFASMALESHPNCSFDFVKIYDGLNEQSPLLQEYCTTSVPGPIESSGNEASIHFHSDPFLSSTGFSMTYIARPRVPGCGGILTGDRGEFSLPTLLNNYHHEMECDWEIRVSPGEKIRLNFTSFRLERARRCRYDYVEIYDGPDSESRLFGRFCGINAPPPLLSSANKLFVVFKSDDTVSYEGFNAIYEVDCGGEFGTLTGEIKSPYYPNAYPHDRDCIYVIRQPLGKAIILNFTNFDVEGPGSNCWFDYLEIRDGASERGRLIGHYCGSGNYTPGVIVSTLNVLWLKFHTDGNTNNHGFRAFFHTIDIRCGGHYSDENGIIRSPNSPIQYPSDTDCNWIIETVPGNVIQITWLTFALETHFLCNYDYIEIFDNSTIPGTGGLMSGGRLCGTTLPPSMTSISNMVTVHFHSDSSVNHDGFQFSYHTINASRACGGTYHMSSGMIQTPLYPLGYPRERTCIWKLNLPVNKQIRLKFVDFDLEPGISDNNCNYDYLEIRNGAQATSHLLKRLCGRNQTIENIMSHSHQLYLKFHSDPTVFGRGFKMFWEEGATGCGGTLSSVSGRFTSPGYPGSYHRLATCYWTIRVNKGSTITLNFLELNLGESVSCYSNYIEIFDGSSMSAPSLAKFCSSQNLASVNSTRNELYVKFRGGWVSGARGFNAEYHSVCNVQLRELRGVIESPNYPYDYPHNRNCTWTILAPRGNSINISFIDFEVEDPQSLTSDNCGYDYVEVKVGTFENDARTVKGHFCDQNIPGDIYSGNKMDVMDIQFVSDQSVAKNGFSLEYFITGCSEILRGLRGTFNSPNYPNAYPTNTECSWLIIGQPGTRIKITFHEYDIEGSANDQCIYDVIRVYGGSDTNAPVLLDTCHSQEGTNSVVTTQGSQALVRLISDMSIRGKGFRASYEQLQGGCGGVFANTGGAIHSPHYPNKFDAPLNCIYSISVDETHVVELEIMEGFNLRTSRNCSREYLAIYDGSSANGQELLKHCGGNLPSITKYKSSGHHMIVQLFSNYTTSSTGFTANYKKGCGATLDVSVEENGRSALKSPNFPRMLERSADCTWHLRAPEGSRVRLSFTHLNIHEHYYYVSSNSSCQEDYVAIYDGDNINSTEIGRHCGSHIPREIYSSSRWLTVRYKTVFGEGIGFRAIYTALDTACGGSFTSFSGEFASPNYPDSYPAYYDCEWQITGGQGNGVQLSFQVFNMEESENCNLDYLEVHERSPAGKLLLHNCSNVIPSSVIGVGSLWVHFKSDGQGTADGFLATFQILTTNIINSDNGYIESPLYPHLYTKSAVHTWRLSVSRGKVIRLSEFQLAIEMHAMEDVCYSSLVVHHGINENGPILKTLCGYAPPDQDVISYSNNLFIRFLTNFRHEGSSFRFKYEAVDYSYRYYARRRPINNDVQSNCSFVIALNSTSTINSPNYPNNYNNNMRCEWILESEIGTKIRLFIMRLRLEEGYRCQHDALEIYDGLEGTTRWNKTATLCRRNQRRRLFYSSGRFMRLRFNTDGSVTKPGFSIRAYTVCGGFLSDSYGVIKSPRYPNNYPSYSNCRWNIKVKLGRTIRLDFDEFRLASEDANCNGDHLLIYNGLTSSSPFLGNGRFCSSVRPPMLESSSNGLTINFTSNSQDEDRGFVIRYEETQAACGFRHHLSESINNIIIQSPNYPHPPHPHSECEWIITGLPNKALGIDFISFDVSTASDSECEHAFVEIRDGGTRMAHLLQKSCGNDIPSSKVSSGSTIYIRYFTNAETVHSGFKANITSGHCGGTYSDMSGVLTSPNYPTSYGPNNNCTWHIKSEQGHYLTFQFSDIRIFNPASNCTSSNTNRLLIKDAFANDSVAVCGFTNTVEQFSSDSYYAIANFANNATARGSNRFRVFYNTSIEECGGIYTGRNGTIISPGYPHGFSHKQWCEWKIIGPPGTRITFQFEDLDFSQGNFYLMIKNGLLEGEKYSSPRLYIHQYNIPANYSTNMNEAKVILRAYRSSTSRGFKITWDTNLPQYCGGILQSSNGSIASPGLLAGAEYNHSTYCAWTITNANPSSSAIRLTFDYMHLEAPCYDYIVLETVSSSGESSFFKKICQIETQLQYIVPYPQVKIHFLSDSSVSANGFNMTYTTNNCGGFHTGPQNVFSSPGYPQNYPPNSACGWAFVYEEGSQIELEFNSFSLEDSLHHDFVMIYNGRDSRSPLLGQYTGTSQPETIISMTNFLYIYFQSDGSGSSTGFSALTRLHSRGCGGIFHSISGNISSPGYRNNSDYPANTECQWKIHVSPGYHIQINFRGRFDIETSEGCQNDYLQIFYPNMSVNGNEWVSQGRKCGKEMPQLVNSNSSSAKLYFKSNEGVQGKGFKMSWLGTCGGSFSQPEGYILSPLHPDVYPVNSSCIYNIVAKPQSFVILNFTAFSVEEKYYGRGCYDSLTISQKRWGRWRVKNTLCGRTLPSLKVFRGPVKLNFTSDFYLTEQHNGFLLKYSIKECGDNRTEPGIIRLPMHPAQYMNRMRCVWRITAPQDKVILFKFQSLHLEWHLKCRYDYVSVYQGNQINQNKLLNKFCGDHSADLPMIATNVSSATILFNADYVRPAGGFVLAYEFTYKCGGFINLTAPGASQFIRSLDADNDGNYEPLLLCQWTIIGAADMVISLNFTRLEVEGPNANDTEACPYDFVKAYDGATSEDFHIGTFCGSPTQLPNITTSGNVLYVTFTSDSSGIAAGFTASLKNIPKLCGGSVLLATNVTHRLQSPNYADPYPPLTICRWRIKAPENKEISLHFDEINLDSSPQCAKDQLRINDYTQHSEIIRSGSSLNTYTIGGHRVYYPRFGNEYTYCGTYDTHNLYLYSANNDFDIRFRSDDETSNARGFSLHYSIANCNRTYNSSSGIIRNRSGISDTNCFTKLIALTDKYISLYFSSFYFPRSGGSFEVFDGLTDDEDKLIISMRGYQSPVIFSPRNELLIKMIKPESNYFRYTINFATSDYPNGCGGQFFGKNYYMTSPDYPNSPRSNQDCLYTLAVPASLNIAIRFRRLDFAANCSSTYLEIYDILPSSESRLYSRFCGGDNPSDHLSPTNRMVVRFVTGTANITGEGWRARVQGFLPHQDTVFDLGTDSLSTTTINP